VQDFLTSSKDFYVIGIDRGERHLLYLSLINSKGEIILQDSLNTILNEHNKKQIDYREKLDGKEKERDEARKNWDVIENIKELKEGYLSQIVHQISKLMVEKKAILIMEDLNFGFKRGRFKVEKQVYQKFEKMLIDKLNYLIFKDKKPTEPGGSLNAFQLSNQFESFKKLGKQSGMIFYVPANHTSKIDPTTGFFNFLYPDVTSLEKGKEFFDKFDKIIYNPKKDYFEFHCRYGSFVSEPSGDKKNDDLGIYNKIKNKEWVICSNKEERFRSFKNNSGHIEYKLVDVNSELIKIFKEENINYSSGKSLKSEIISSQSSSFLKSISDQLKILLALRYNNGKKGEEERDFILSPVLNKDGKFFHSEKVKNKEPNNADANGAYNIALKGLLLVEKIKAQKGSQKKNLAISNLDWFEYIWERNFQ
jgi:CRISPR-associated protein Cpf1